MVQVLSNGIATLGADSNFSLVGEADFHNRCCCNGFILSWRCAFELEKVV